MPAVAAKKEVVPAKVVDLFVPERISKGKYSEAPEGYREVEVVATAVGYYNHTRHKVGQRFTMAFVSEGALPSWVTPFGAKSDE